MPMKAIVLAAVLVAVLATAPAAAHVPDHCSADEITQAQEEKREATQELRRAVQRQDPAAIYQRFIQFIQADARQGTARDRFMDCVEGQ